MKPYVHHFGTSANITWNLDCSIGRKGQNSRLSDISFLQWYYSLAARNALTPADRRATYGKVSVSGKCTGADSDPLVAAILAHQKALQHPVLDGKVSVAPGHAFIGQYAFFILRLCARLADMFPREWPRLDLIPECPPGVAQDVLAAVPRVSVG